LISGAGILSETLRKKGNGNREGNCFFLPTVDIPHNLIPAAEAGLDAVVIVGEAVPFWGSGVSPEYGTVKYAWDFDGDGVNDFVSKESGHTAITFCETGSYRSPHPPDTRSATLTQ
jgi:hypothetical protein